jgi:cell division septal protein FtsQ
LTARRSKPSLLARLRRYWIIGILGAVVLLIAGRLAERAPLFEARTPAVSGNARVPAALVVRRAAIDPHANVWLLDARAVERRVEAIPYVLRATLHRGFPGGSRIEIAERKPDGCVRSDVALVTIDADRRVLQDGCLAPVVFIVRGATEFAAGSFVADPALQRLQTDARTLDARGRKLTDFAFDDFGELEATLPGGIRVRFGEDGEDGDLGLKQRLIGPILAALGPRVTSVSAIDLRAPSTPVVEHKRRAGKPAKSSPQQTDTL